MLHYAVQKLQNAVNNHFIVSLLLILCGIVALTLIYYVPVFLYSFQKSGTFLINTTLQGC